MSTEETPPPTTEPPLTKPTVIHEEPIEPKIPEVIRQQMLDLTKEVKGLRADAKRKAAEEEAIKINKTREDKLSELKGLNKAMYEVYKDKTDMIEINAAIDASKLSKKTFSQLVDTKDKDDSKKIPTGKDPLTGKIVKF